MLIVLSGRTASGKSTTAKALAGALNGKSASFGGYVRHLAVAKGLDANDRLTLQDLGQKLVESDAQAFTADFLKFADYNPNSVLVVDGLRHLLVLQCLKNSVLPPDRFVLVYVEIGDNERRARLMSRGNTETEIDNIEKHPSEIDVLAGLARVADITVDGNVPIDRQIELITAKI